MGFADQTSLTRSTLILGLAVVLLAAAFGSAYGCTPRHDVCRTAARDLAGRPP
ncbi:SPW repeat protein [Rhodococcus sp. NPDC019627]|uniref:SPW repeat domain-containing protein n=1 Tax=unclassified Rhodococcus (in: high G+C Gram-positive bacteria) TaxID=192944 RepID=UPI0033DFBEFF